MRYNRASITLCNIELSTVFSFFILLEQKIAILAIKGGGGSLNEKNPPICESTFCHRPPY